MRVHVVCTREGEATMSGNVVGHMTHMPTDEFVDFGYLQEVNRLFLHTLGLALMVKVHDSGRVELAGIWRTDDPEGLYFDELDPGKAQRVNTVAENIALARVKALGYVVQPVDRI